MKISGSVTIGDTTSGDTVNGAIAALNTSDINIGGGKSYFGKDGSGYLANKSIVWDSGGTMSIGKFIIGNEGIYNGNINEWTNEGVGQDMAYLTPSILRLQLQDELHGKYAKLKVGFGKYADPTHTSGGKYDSAAYFYRRMIPMDPYSFYPAVKIISDNQFNGNIALYVEGGVINRNGSLNNAYFMNADQDSIIHFDRSDTQIVINRENGRIVQLPTKLEMQKIMGVDTFAVTLTVISHFINNVIFKLAFNSIDANPLDGPAPVWRYNNGNTLFQIEMNAGKVLHFVLISNGKNFWAQVL